MHISPPAPQTQLSLTSLTIFHQDLLLGSPLMALSFNHYSRLDSLVLCMTCTVTQVHQVYVCNLSWICSSFSFLFPLPYSGYWHFLTSEALVSLPQSLALRSFEKITATESSLPVNNVLVKKKQLKEGTIERSWSWIKHPWNSNPAVWLWKSHWTSLILPSYSGFLKMSFFSTGLW